MIKSFPALAALAPTLLTLALPTLALPAAASAAPPKKVQKPAAKKPAAKKKVAQKKVEEKKPQIIPAPSEGAMRVAAWVATSGDNQSLPYAIIDKPTASIRLFDAKGEMLAEAPVLIGIALGDEATPGVGSKNLSEIGPAEKTTPAGRYLAKFGLALGRERVLWVDYATSVAMHTIPKTSPKKERRRERMLSETPDDNRVTFGCINVPILFYSKSLSPAFQKKGGYVYITPDEKPIEEVFPRLRVEALKTGGMG